MIHIFFVAEPFCKGSSFLKWTFPQGQHTLDASDSTIPTSVCVGLQTLPTCKLDPPPFLFVGLCEMPTLWLICKYHHAQHAKFLSWWGFEVVSEASRLLDIYICLRPRKCICIKVNVLSTWQVFWFLQDIFFLFTTYNVYFIHLFLTVSSFSLSDLVQVLYFCYVMHVWQEPFTLAVEVCNHVKGWLFHVLHSSDLVNYFLASVLYSEVGTLIRSDVYHMLWSMTFPFFLSHYLK